MKYKFFYVVILILSLLLVAGCGEKEETVARDQLVKTQVVGLNKEGQYSTYSGNIKGRYETNMAFQVGGIILSRNVEIGDRVHAGDVLMTIDARDVLQKANQGDAQVEATRAQLNLAQKNLARYRELYAAEAIPASVLDQYKESYDAALANYENAVAQSIQGHNALEYTNLVATADGAISDIKAEAGQVVVAGQVVLTIVQEGEQELEVNIPEKNIAYATVGKQVDISIWALKTKVEGIIREIAPMADSVARTYKARISIPKPPTGMQLGMTASVDISAENNDANILLPLSAIYQNTDKKQVWVVNKDDMTLSLRDVQAEVAEKNMVKVIGLKNGEIVVTAGVHRLREGQKVRLEED